MATYDLTITTPTSIQSGDILNCPYSGTYKVITLPKGTYKLECWGAQGGTYSTSNVGGFGGYSTGVLKLTQQATLYLYAGGQPINSGILNQTTPGGWNGGGSGRNCTYSNTTRGSGGGGGTDIRINSTSLFARVIVAGGAEEAPVQITPQQKLEEE